MELLFPESEGYFSVLLLNSNQTPDRVMGLDLELPVPETQMIREGWQGAMWKGLRISFLRVPEKDFHYTTWEKVDEGRKDI
jgi:hypothetical protein